MTRKISPFLKWAGGKRWLVASNPGVFTVPFNRYIEPFLGSGAVFFAIAPATAILSDSNRELIEAYVAVRDAPEKVYDLLRLHQRNHSQDYYYKLRDQRPRKPETKAARFIYLNRTCFNAIYRVNLKGVFNVPKGSKDRVLLPDDDFGSVSQLLKNAEISSSDFETTIARAGHGDFVFIDPPYTVKHNTNSFVKYNEKIFSWADQVRLEHASREAAARGASVLITNADHPSIHDLYDGDGLWTKTSVYRSSQIASDRRHRGTTTELLISNFDIGIARGLAPPRQVGVGVASDG